MWLPVAAMCLLLGVELVLLRQWIDVVAGLRPDSVAAVMAQRGTVRLMLVRFAVVFALLSVVFVDVKSFAAPKRFLKHTLRGAWDWRLSLLHLAAVALGTAASVWLLEQPAADVGVPLVGGWLVLVACIGVTGTLVFTPAAFFAEAFRSLRDVIGFSALVAVSAYGFGELSFKVWPHLSRATMATAAWLLHPFVPDLIVDSENLVMGRPEFLIRIEAACSGADGLGLMLAVMAALLWFDRKEWRFPRVLLLLPIALALEWIFNAVRVAGLVLIGVRGAPGVALGGFHSQAGWVACAVVALGICLGARRVPWFLRGHREQPTAASDASNPVAPFLMPFLFTLGASMVALSFSGEFEWLYPLRVVAAAVALWYFRRRYASLTWRVGAPALLWGMLIYVIWIAYEYFASPAPVAAMPGPLRAAPLMTASAWIAFRAAGAILTLPVVEELAFRGFLMRRFSGTDFDLIRWADVSWSAVVLSSLAFGLLHGQRWLPATLAGIGYAIAVKQRGSFGDAVVAHAITNALIAVTVLLTGWWHLW